MINILLFILDLTNGKFDIIFIFSIKKNSLYTNLK